MLLAPIPLTTRFPMANNATKPPTSERRFDSEPRLLHTLLNALLPRRIGNEEIPLLQHRLEGFDNLVEAAGRTALLREAENAKVASTASFEDGEEVGVEVDGF
jgi:hypothetical protein